MPSLYPSALRIAVCDDDTLFLRDLKDTIKSELPEQSAEIVVSEDPSVILADPQPFQIAVLDIRFRDTDGIRVAKDLLARAPGCQIIFVSGYTEFVSAVYDVAHLCMILKEDVRTELPKFLRRAIGNLAAIQKQILEVTSRGQTDLVAQENICYIERRGHNTFVVLHDGRQVVTTEKLDKLMEQLNGITFCRCHVSYIVNFHSVTKYDRRQFIMSNGAIIPISRINMEPTKNKFMLFVRQQLPMN